MIEIDDTVSVLWSNLHGDTLRSLVRIDRQWFADGVVVSGDTLRIRRPAGMVGPYWVYAGWGAMGTMKGGGIRDTLEAGETMLEIVTPVAGAWSELRRITFTPVMVIVEESPVRSAYARDTIATDPVQYIESADYSWIDPAEFRQPRCDGCLRP